MDASLTFSDIKNSDMKSDLSDLECSEQKTKKTNTQAVKVCAAVAVALFVKGLHNSRI